MSEAAAAGTIYDLGYQHYQGERLGRANAFRTLASYSLRAAFGLGRGERAKLVPIMIGLFCFVPVIGQLVMANASGDASRIDFAQQTQFTNLFLILYAAAQAPEIVVLDRQLGVLGLYLSRSLRSTDYAFAKLTAMICALLFCTFLPQILLYVGSILVGGSPWHTITQSWHNLGPIAGTSVVVSCYLATVSIALASLAARKGYASASVIAFFLMMPVLAGLASVLLPQHLVRYASLGNPVESLTRFAQWAFGVAPVSRRVPQRFPNLGADYLYSLVITTALAAGMLTYRFRRSDI